MNPPTSPPVPRVAFVRERLDVAILRGDHSTATRLRAVLDRLLNPPQQGKHPIPRSSVDPVDEGQILVRASAETVWGMDYVHPALVAAYPTAGEA